MVIPCNYPQQDVCGRSVSNTTCRSSSRRSPPPSGHAEDAGHGNQAYDVSFIVGPDGDTWTIRGRRNTLRMASTELAALLSGNEDAIRVTGFDKRGFEYLLRHLEGSEPNFTSVPTARNTLDVAYKYQCISLVKSCIAYLDLNLDARNALFIYKNLSNYCGNIYTNLPSAPQLNTIQMNENLATIQNYCSSLLHNCLLIIDANAEIVLTKDEIDNFSFRDLSLIVTRDFLSLENELVLFNCLVRWLKCQCMREEKDFNVVARQNLLGDLIFHVRFVKLSKEAFLAGPGTSGLFTSDEISKIIRIIENPTLHCDTTYSNMIKPRIKSNLEPKYLSSRTKPALNTDKNKKKIKNKKDKNSNTLLNCLTIWTVLFD